MGLPIRSDTSIMTGVPSMQLSTHVNAQTLRRLVDIGANLTHKAFAGSELESVLERAQSSGVTKIIVTGTDVQGSENSLRLAKLHPGLLYSTVGVHPHDAKTFTPETLTKLESLASEPECVAIGECGLDYNRMFSPKEQQLHAFEQQVSLACRLKKPLFIHERDAHEDLAAILNKYKSTLPAAVVHCFSGKISEAQAYINMGLYIGLTGIFWKDKLEDGVQAGLKEKAFPLERLMIETDSPFCYPNVKAKKLPKSIKERMSEHASNYLFRYCSFNRNEPCALPAIAEMIATFMEVDPDEVFLNTTINAMKVFGLD